jgi:hypothetical protein
VWISDFDLGDSMSYEHDAIEYIERRIAEFYRHDISILSLAGNPFGVHTSLRVLHEIWAYINGKESQFDSLLRRQMRLCECNTQVFCDTYKRKHPDATADEVAAYEVAQWKCISLDLGIFAESEDSDFSSK